MKKRNFWLAGVSGLTVIVPTVAVVSCGGGGDKKEDTTKNQGQSIPKVETGENANSSNSALAEFAKKYPNAIDVSTKTIKEGAFKDAVLPDDFVLPDEIVKIDRDAFHGAKIPKGFKLPSELKEIGPWALATIEFSDSFVIPDKVEIIRDDAFRNSSLPKKVVILSLLKALNMVRLWLHSTMFKNRNSKVLLRPSIDLTMFIVYKKTLTLKFLEIM